MNFGNFAGALCLVPALSAPSAADAHLVLEAVARYGASKLVVGPKYFVYLFKAGGRSKPEALTGVPRDWPKPGWFSDAPCVQFHYYRPEEPFIVFRTVDDQRWRDVMNTGPRASTTSPRTTGPGSSPREAEPGPFMRLGSGLPHEWPERRVLPSRYFLRLSM